VRVEPFPPRLARRVFDEFALLVQEQEQSGEGDEA
jgi:hypothetical protein